MMIPFPVLMVPLLSIFRWMGDHTGIQFLGTFKPLWFPWWFGQAFSIFLLRQFFLTIPDELSEAARIDGCSEWGIFWRVVLPLSRPALTVVALFTFMFVWRDFLGALVYLQRPSQYTLALGLQSCECQQWPTPRNKIFAARRMGISTVILVLLQGQ
jgi:multiple sugar transport system permease protein